MSNSLPHKTNIPKLAYCDASAKEPLSLLPYGTAQQRQIAMIDDCHDCTATGEERVTMLTWGSRGHTWGSREAAAPATDHPAPLICCK